MTETLTCLSTKFCQQPWKSLKFTFGKANLVVEEEGLKVLYPKGSYKPSASDNVTGGAGFYGWPSHPQFPTETAHLHYEVFFPNPFPWTKGGKLPGLFIGSPGASGGRHEEGQASVRVMWRKDGDVECYIYTPLQVLPTEDERLCLSLTDVHPNDVVRNKVYGDSLWRGCTQFHTGEWNSVDIWVQLNSTNTFSNTPCTDGTLRIRVNGTERQTQTLLWRCSPDIKISGFMFSTFFGGATPDYATPSDTFCLFRNVTLE